MQYKLWSKKEKKFIKNGWIVFPDGRPFWITYGEIDAGVYMKDHVLIKSTGIKNIDNIEIYEGDILKCKLYNGEYENYVIVWDEEEAGFDALNEDKSNFMLPSIWTVSEIIGNIHENPELFYSDKGKK